MTLKLCGIAFFFISQISCGQNNNQHSAYNEADYKEVRRGEERSSLYVIFYVHKSDTSYTMKKMFPLDSTYNEENIVKTFYFHNVANGPYERYTRGKLTEKGFFKNGIQDGERLRYRDGLIYSKSYFNEGKKTGTWYEYDKSGKAIRKIIYENDVLKSDVDL